ncbi:MAG TPA: transglycosylase SLT domain-containing protein [Pyrinomonadaceae bacterium]|jgi:LysM repeat protein
MMTTNIQRRLLIALLTAVAILIWGASVQAQKSSNARSAHTRPARGRSGKASKQVKVRVGAGESLNMIAARFGVPVETLARLNGLTVNDQPMPGQEIIVPDPSALSLAANSTEAPVLAADDVRRDGSRRLSLLDGTIVEADEVWEDEQGVRYRRGGVTYLVERARVRAIERGTPVAQDASAVETPVEKGDQQIARLVEVSANGINRTMQPVWIYLVGGARVEADDVMEAATGVWYRRGTLSIFLASSRIERIERETLQQTAADAGSVPSRKERGWSTGNAKTDALIRQNGARYGVDPYLIFCVMEQESHFNARVVSPKGARGLMQLMPGTGARFGVRKPFDPAENIMGGTRYLKQLLEQFGGRVDLVLASYNAGEGAVMKYGGRIPPYRETRDYVKRISKRYGKSTTAGDAPNTVANASRLR